MPLINKNGATSSVNCHINKLYLFCSRQKLCQALLPVPMAAERKASGSGLSHLIMTTHQKCIWPTCGALPFLLISLQKMPKNTTKKKEKHHNEPKNDLPFQSKESWGNFFIAARISVCVSVCVDLVSSAVGVLWQLDRPRRGMGMRAGDQLRLSARISFAACGGRRQKCR